MHVCSILHPRQTSILETRTLFDGRSVVFGAVLAGEAAFHYDLLPKCFSSKNLQFRRYLPSPSSLPLVAWHALPTSGGQGKHRQSREYSKPQCQYTSNRTGLLRCLNTHSSAAPSKCTRNQIQGVGIWLFTASTVLVFLCLMVLLVVLLVSC